MTGLPADACRSGHPADLGLPCLRGGVPPSLALMAPMLVFDEWVEFDRRGPGPLMNQRSRPRGVAGDAQRDGHAPAIGQPVRRPLR